MEDDYDLEIGRTLRRLLMEGYTVEVRPYEGGRESRVEVMIRRAPSGLQQFSSTGSLHLSLRAASRSLPIFQEPKARL